MLFAGCKLQITLNSLLHEIFNLVDPEESILEIFENLGTVEILHGFLSSIDQSLRLNLLTS